MAAGNDNKKFPPRGKLNEREAEDNSSDFFAQRGLMDGLFHGYLSARQWLRVKMWVDRVQPEYCLGELQSSVKENNKSPKKKQLRTNEDDAHSLIRTRIDVQSRQKQGDCIGDKKEIGMRMKHNKGSKCKQLKPNKICVTGLYRALKTNDVTKLFEVFGRIVSIVHRNSIGRDGRRCALIVFADSESACRAVKNMNDKQIYGCKIQITTVQ